jgi:hypothetical protein
MTTTCRIPGVDRKSSLFFHSTVAFVLGGMLAVTAHELSHLVAGLLLGEQATLYPTAVEFAGDRATSDATVTAATGPIFSLVSGIVLIFTTRHAGRGFGRLLWMWFAFMSAQTGFGYLMIAVFAREGDTGRVLDNLGAPGFVYWLSLAVGVAGMLWLSRMFAARVLAYTDGTVPAMRAFGLFSWLAGSAVLLIVYALAVRDLEPDLIVICLLGVFASGVFAPMFSFFHRSLSVPSTPLTLSTPITGLVSAAVLALVLVLVVAGGVPVG